jgi:hypothetical protein
MCPFAADVSEHTKCKDSMLRRSFVFNLVAGKTYVGIQILKLLIGNTTNSQRDADRHLRGRGRIQHQPAAAQPAPAAAGGKSDVGPILAVCYTNHAIDSLLEGLLDAGVATGRGEMVRVGGGSKSERLAALNLREVRGRIRESTMGVSACCLLWCKPFACDMQCVSGLFRKSSCLSGISTLVLNDSCCAWFHLRSPAAGSSSTALRVVCLCTKLCLPLLSSECAR